MLRSANLRNEIEGDRMGERFVVVFVARERSARAVFQIALAIWFAPPAFRDWARNALVAYGMVILAFVGALHWGFTMKTPEFDERDRWTWMGWSVTPALLAWTASLFPFRPAVAILAATFVVHLAVDHLFASRSGLPPWYLTMRRALTAAVVLGLVIAFAAPA